MARRSHKDMFYQEAGSEYAAEQFIASVGPEAVAGAEPGSPAYYKLLREQLRASKPKGAITEGMEQ